MSSHRDRESRLRNQISRWRDDLIDLSKRNRLLWFRATATSTFELCLISDRLMIVRPHFATPLRLSLYVPHPESNLCSTLARGSAIVGLPLATGNIRIYYEGNVIGAQNLKRYRDRAVQAAGRMLHNYPAGYPTRARQDVDPREVVEVGAIDAKTYRIDISAGPTDLSWWIDTDDLVDLGVIQKVG